jgi:type VI secretion system protein VasJ
MALAQEDLVKRVQSWLEPVSAAAPTGTNARYDPDYERVLGEVAKLEAPTGGTVDWVQVGKLGGGILQKKSKDLLVAAYTGYSFFGTKRSIGGLLDGLVLISELLDRHWDTLFPDLTRSKARSNAVGWFLQRATIAFGTVTVSGGDRDTVDALLPAAQRLAELARTKFAGGGPAFGPILEALERLKLQLPPEAPPTPVPDASAPSRDAAPSPAGVLTETTTSATTSAAFPPPLPAQGGDTENYVSGVGEALATTAANLRRANLADPLAYRLLRTGLWLPVSQLPPKGPNGRAPFPPLRPALRTQLDTMAANGKSLELIEEAESALVQNRFNLDLSRFTARALAALGSTYDAARKAVEAEVAGLLRRMPGAPELLANDGTPVADGQTRAWLDMEVGAAAGPGGGAAGGSDDTAAAVREAKSLFAAGNSSDGLALLQSRVQSANNGHSRFRLRLELAKLCVAANQPGLARAIYSALAKECTVHDLDTWEPLLTVECLEGLLSCRPSGALSTEDNGYYQRLCGISPTAAMRIQT